MEDKQIRYLDNVVDLLVDDTNIDYGGNHIGFPFFPLYRLYINDGNLDYFFLKDWYNRYCKDMYGLTEDESKYIWERYIGIILNKIDNER